MEAATAQASKAVEVLQDAVQKAESNQKLATKSGPVIDKIAKANWAKAAGKKSAKLGIQLQDSCFRSGNEMMRQACTFAVLGVVSWGMFSAASTYIRLAGTGTEDKVSLAQLDPEHFAEFTKKVGDLEQLVSMNPKEFEAISAVPENGKPGGAIYQLSREGSETCLEPAQVAKKYK